MTQSNFSEIASPISFGQQALIICIVFLLVVATSALIRFSDVRLYKRNKSKYDAIKSEEKLALAGVRRGFGYKGRKAILVKEYEKKLDDIYLGIDEIENHFLYTGVAIVIFGLFALLAVNVVPFLL